MIDKFLILLLMLWCPVFELRTVHKQPTDSRPLFLRNHEIFFKQRTPVKQFTFDKSQSGYNSRVFGNHEGAGVQKSVTDDAHTDTPINGHSDLKFVPFHGNGSVVNSFQTRNVLFDLESNDRYDNLTIATDSASLYPVYTDITVPWTKGKLNINPTDYRVPFKSRVSDSLINEQKHIQRDYVDKVFSRESESMKHSAIPVRVEHVLGSPAALISPGSGDIHNITVEWATRNDLASAEMPRCIGSICKQTNKNISNTHFDNFRNKRQIIVPSDAPSEQKRLFRQTATPLRVAQSVSVRYRNSFYFTASSTKIVTHLPFKDLISTILGLYQFSTVMSNDARLDSLEYREIHLHSNAVPDYTLRAYEQYAMYNDQSSLCQGLNLSHVNPLAMSSNLNDSLSYFLPVTIFNSNRDIFCTIANGGDIVGKDCVKYITQLCLKYKKLCNFQIDSKYDELRSKQPGVYHAISSSTHVSIVDSTRTAAIVCKGKLIATRDTTYNLDRFYANIYFSKLSNIFISLIDVLHIELITLEELFFMVQPPNSVGLHKSLKPEFLIKEIRRYLPVEMAHFQGNSLLTVSPREKLILTDLMFQDRPLMNIFTTLHGKNRTFWDKHDTSDLGKIGYAMKSLYFDISATYSFFLPGRDAKKIFPLPIEHIVRPNTSPESYKTSLVQMLQKDLSDREVLFVYILTKNYLIETLHNIRQHIKMDFVIPDFESVANILRHPPERPDKRSSLFVFKDLVGNTTSDEDEDEDDMSNYTSIQVPTLVPTTQTPDSSENEYSFLDMPQINELLNKNIDLDIINHIRAKRNLFSNFFSDLLGLPAYSDLDKITESERVILKEQLAVEQHLSSLANSSTTLYNEVNNFRKNLNKFDKDNHNLGIQLSSILDKETKLTEEMLTISKSLDSNVKNSISYTQLSAGIMSVINHLKSLSNSVQSLITGDFPSNLVPISQVFTMIPTNTLISLKFAHMQPQMTDKGHAIAITLPVISTNFLVYELTSIPFLVSPTPSTVSDNSSHFITHQMVFPTRYVGIGIDNNYFQFNTNPCTTKGDSVLCHPVDVQVRTLNSTCYHQLVTETGINHCLGHLVVSAGKIPNQQYTYTPDRQKVMIFTPTPDTASFKCTGTGTSKIADDIVLQAGMSLIVLPAKCTLRTRELSIYSGTLVGVHDIPLVYTPQTDVFTKEIMEVHATVGTLNKINVSELIGNIAHYKKSVENIPLINLSRTDLNYNSLFEISEFNPFTTDLSSPAHAAIWLQIICMCVMFILICTCCYCTIWCCCPRCTEAWEKRIKKCCSCLNCFKKRTSIGDIPQTSRLRRGRGNDHRSQLNIDPVPVIIPLEEVQARTPETSAPGSRRSSFISQFARNIQRRSLIYNNQPTDWQIVSQNYRLRLCCNTLDRIVYYNTKQDCVVNDGDEPESGSSARTLTQPSLELINTFHTQVEARPVTAVKMGSYDITFQNEFYYNEVTHCWHRMVNHYIVDGLRRPRSLLQK